MEFGTDTFNQLRKHWKYTSGVKGVGGAPIFFANGVKIDNAENYEFQDWINFIQKYTFN